MDAKEAISILKSNYPHGMVFLCEAVDLAIEALKIMEKTQRVEEEEDLP